jgi:DNA-binding transcriptional MerR regulator
VVNERTGHRPTRDRGRDAWRRGEPLPVGSAAIGSGSIEPYRYTMADLERETGISARTIRYYITVGLLPPAKGRGVGATYGPAHLLRLKMINRLKEDHLPLEEMKQRLAGLREDDLAAMLQVETAPPEDRWRRVMLHPDLELHVREPGGKPKDYGFEKVVDTIIKQSSILLDHELDDRR